MMLDADHTDTHVGPYGEAAMRYHAAGWSPLPLPPRAKKPVPNGWTGAQGAWPSGADVHAWTEDHGGGNVALRLPQNVIGIDVDAYGDKVGGLLLHDLEGRLGALPPTWRSTSRDDGVSGIRFYTVPEGLRWPSILGPGIEVIRYGHRYAVAWPSLHPDTGGTYRWVTPDGATALTDIPTPEALPALPSAWVEHFTHGEAAVDQARAGLDAAAVGDWLTTRGGGPVCPVTDHALKKLLTDLAVASSRHDAALTGTNRLVWTAGLGHTGAVTALSTARSVWLASVGKDRAPGEAEAEWDRLIIGAVDLAAAAHPNTEGSDPCLDPFHGLLPPGRHATPTAATPTGPGSVTSPSVTSSSSSASPAASPTTSPPPSSSEEPPAPAEDTRTTWWPVDLTDYIHADPNDVEHPAHLMRSDMRAAFYPGRINGIIGPSESGKTWVALHSVVQAVHDGDRVTILDFEDSPKGIISRLRLLGLSTDQIEQHVRYINPDAPFHPLLPTGLDVAEHLDTWRPALVVLDGFNAAMSLQGLELKDNTDVTVFFQNVLRNLARNDATVVYIDHTPKDTENRSSGGIGAQAKRAMTTGCTLKADPVRPFGKGQNGKIRLYVDKDRIGEVRGASPTTKTGHWFADLLVTSTPEGGLTLELVVPEGFDADTGQRAAFRPTILMARVSAYVQDNPQAGRNEIIRDVTGNDRGIATALAILVDEGFIVAEKHGQKKLHTSVTPYTEVSDLVETQPGANRVPTGGQAPGYETGCHRVPTGGDVVSRYPAPGSTPSGHVAQTDRMPNPGRIVERSIAGERVRFNLDTGAVER